MGVGESDSFEKTVRDYLLDGGTKGRKFVVSDYSSRIGLKEGTVYTITEFSHMERSRQVHTLCAYEHPASEFCGWDSVVARIRVGRKDFTADLSYLLSHLEADSIKTRRRSVQSNKIKR